MKRIFFILSLCSFLLLQLGCADVQAPVCKSDADCAQGENCDAKVGCIPTGTNKEAQEISKQHQQDETNNKDETLPQQETVQELQAKKENNPLESQVQKEDGGTHESLDEKDEHSPKEKEPADNNQSRDEANKRDPSYLCPSSSCVIGTKQCQLNSVEECVADAKGCGAWKAFPCKQGEVCKQGSCQQQGQASCKQDTDCPYQQLCDQHGQCQSCKSQCKSNETSCKGNEIIECIESNGCSSWQSKQTCAKDETCEKGSCVQSNSNHNCKNECKPNETSCKGNESIVCSLGKDGCYYWSSKQTCAKGETCEKGTCVKSNSTCKDQCKPGTTSCDSNKVMNCKQLNGCYQWVSAHACKTGEICEKGTCVKSSSGTCKDQCKQGEVTCKGNEVIACSKGKNGCYEWTSKHKCQHNETCQKGSCAPSTPNNNCKNECKQGERSCSGSTVIECYQGNDGCYHWKKIQCVGNQTCQQGKCVSSCKNECKQGESKCYGNTVLACYTQNGCSTWVKKSACSSPLVCEKGTCVKKATTCKDQCKQGEVSCKGNEVITCSLDKNGCYDWSSKKTCDSGETCEKGACVKSSNTCKDQCKPGTTSCDSNKVMNCKQLNGCYQWVSAHACKTGEVCEKGTCVKSSGGTCKDQCKQGEVTCKGNEVLACSKDKNGCYDWVSSKTCGKDEACDKGSCVKTNSNTCKNQCKQGDVRCDGNGIQTCSLFQGCLQWTNTKKCSSDETCEKGSCNKNSTNTCKHECKQGERSCSGSTVIECYQGNDGCYHWKKIQCVGNQTCQQGKCVSACKNECKQGESKCDGNTVLACYTQNGCSTWVKKSACSSPLVCEKGTCVKKTSSNTCNNECKQGESKCDGNYVLTCEVKDNCGTWRKSLLCKTSCVQGTCTK